MQDGVHDHLVLVSAQQVKESIRRGASGTLGRPGPTVQPCSLSQPAHHLSDHPRYPGSNAGGIGVRSGEPWCTVHNLATVGVLANKDDGIRRRPLSSGTVGGLASGRKLEICLGKRREEAGGGGICATDSDVEYLIQRADWPPFLSHASRYHSVLSVSSDTFALWMLIPPLHHDSYPHKLHSSATWETQPASYRRR